LNSRKFSGQRLRSKRNDELRSQVAIVEPAEVLFLAVEIERALDIIVPKDPVRDAAQRPRSLQFRFAVGLVQLDPSKKRGGGSNDAYGDESIGPKLVVYGMVLLREDLVPTAISTLSSIKRQYGASADEPLHCRILFSGGNRSKSKWSNLGLDDVFLIVKSWKPSAR
jgi:hypothetical protein